MFSLRFTVEADGQLKELKVDNGQLKIFKAVSKALFYLKDN